MPDFFISSKLKSNNTSGLSSIVSTLPTKKGERNPFEEKLFNAISIHRIAKVNQ